MQFYGFFEDQQLETVALFADILQLGKRLLSVYGGGDVVTSREHDAVAHLRELGYQFFVLSEREDHRRAAGFHYAFQIFKSHPQVFFFRSP